MDGAHGEWPDETVGPWVVIRTRSRQEKILGNDLRAARVAHFLPLVTLTRLYGGCAARVEVPLFPGYLFLRGSPDEAYAADRAKRAAQIIAVADQSRLGWELRNLYRALDANASLDPFPHPCAGVRVEVRDGPLRGIQGVVEDVDRPHRIILQVRMLGQAVSMDVGGSPLDVLD